MQIKLLYPGVYKAAASVACLVFPSAGVILHFSLLSYAEKKKIPHRYHQSFLKAPFVDFYCI